MKVQTKKNKDTALLKAIESFSKDKSYFEDYDSFTPKEHHVLVRLLVHRPRFNSTKQSPIQVPDGKGGWKTSEQVYDISIIPLVMVIKVPQGENEVSVGDLYSVPRTDVIGSTWNPEYLNYLRSFGEKAENKTLDVKPPVGMTQKIANIDLNWDRYMFVRPWVTKPEIQDMETYLIPKLKLQMKYVI